MHGHMCVAKKKVRGFAFFGEELLSGIRQDKVGHQGILLLTQD